MIKSELEKIIAEKLSIEVSLHKGERFGDYFISPIDTTELLKGSKLDPNNLAEDIFLCTKNLTQRVVFEGGYINFYLNRETILDEISKMVDSPDLYLANDEYKDQIIVFDYSGPNIAKPFSVGHLRSTVIGQANYNVHKVLGSKTIGINHLGDWGTQFGKLIYAIKTWGNEEEIGKDPIKHLTELYVRFHLEAENNESLNESAREWFKKLEQGDSEARRLWEKCVLWSMKEFDRIYELIGVKIDHVQAESFYEDKINNIIDELKQKNLLKQSQGAQIVELENLPPALIQKQDQATLYLTRDLAALKYRIETYKPTKIIYHVGNDQSLHFQQLIALAKKLGYLQKTEIEFAGHGLIRLEGGKMSTRKGHVVLLDDIIIQAKQKACEIIKQKNPDLENIDEVSQKIAINAIKYADLNQNRKSDIVFSFDKVVALKGNSGPYLQYTYARAASILQKLAKDFPDAKPSKHLPDEGLDLGRQILNLADVVSQSAKNSSPNTVCDFAYKLSEQFNAFYENKKIITKDKTESSNNAFIVSSVKIALGICFDLLGMEKLEKI